MLRDICTVDLALSLCLVASAVAQEGERPGQLSSAELNALRPGLQIALETPDGARDVRSARLAALQVPAGQPVSPFLARGPFHATIRGYLKLRLRGDYCFMLRGKGTATLSLNGEQVMVADGSEWSTVSPVKVAMVKGYNRLQIDYQPPLNANAQLRLYWSSEEFTWEPVPPRLLMHDGRDHDWQRGQQLRHGRDLYARQNCAKCHNPVIDVAADGVMPELRRDVPSLAGISNRLHPEWIAAWILIPHSMRNKTTMPSLLPHGDLAVAAKQAQDLVAYLQSLPAVDRGVAVEPNKELVSQGEILFEDRGCIACHRFTHPKVKDEPFDRVSLHFAGAKFQPSALVDYLSNPRAYYKWSRMPSIPLTTAECQALASFVLDAASGEPLLDAGLARGDAERGARLFQSSGCANCHSVVSGRPPAGTRRWMIENTEYGCLAKDDSQRARSPRHALTKSSRVALAAFLKSDGESLGRAVADEFSRRQWETMNCYACHGRDGQNSLLSHVLLAEGIQGHAPEPVPDLTWAGEKLRPEWSQQLFSGQLGYRPRPHLHIRMPRLHARGALISRGLSYEHGFELEEDPRPAHDENLAAVGSELVGMNNGLACFRCHAIGDRQTTAPFGARSTNLSYATERLRYDFYHRWLRDPLRIDPQTKMIQFALDGHRTGLTTYYDGDARQQFDAIWHYLEQLNRESRKNKR